MKLPFSLPFGKKDKPEYFLALLLRNEKVNAVIFEETQGKVRVIGQQEEYFQKQLEDTNEEELLEAIDKAISTAESHLPEGVETQKTIFGVKESWVENAKIKPQHLGFLKKISENLGLSPIGFIVIHEAIVHLMQKEEGAPVSAILVEIDKTAIVVSLIRAGKIVETKSSPIEKSIPETVDQVLHHFDYEILPSRIILFNGVDEEKLTQSFISHSWSRQLPFLHVPQIKALPHGFDAQAVLAGAASQMGFEVLGKTAALPKQKTTEIEKKENIIDSHIEKGEETPEEDIEKKMVDAEVDEEVDEKDNQLETEKAISEPFTPEEEKTLEDEIKAIEHKEKELPKKAVLDHSASIKTGKSFGFVKEKDMHIKKPVERIEEEAVVEIPTEKSVLRTPNRNAKAILVVFSSFLLFLKNLPIKPLLAGATSVIATVGRRLPANKKFVIFPPLILFVVLLVFLTYIFMVKAAVTLFVEPKIAEREQSVLFATGEPTDIENNILSARLLEVTEEGTMKVDTTGKKEIGEKAKGNITILSSQTKEQTFPSGTSITSSNNLVFVLDKEVKISSSSGITDVKSVTATVTAKNIGKEYNLPSGTKFSVGNLDKSSVEAKNDGAFAGGSKKEIDAVSKADHDKLLKELPKTLEEKAKEKAKEKETEKDVILPTFTKITIDNEDFSKEVGEEAGEVSIKATVTYQTLIYGKNDLRELAKKVLENSLSGMTTTDDSLSVDVKDVKEKDDTSFQTTLQIKASLLPKLNVEELGTAIAGKSYDEANEILKKTPQVKETEVMLQPNIFFLPKLLPRRSQNISFSITPNE
jgi:hypothetical protein